MASTRRSLSAFLDEARNALTGPVAQRPRPLTLVVGNESADLDSICSSLILAYVRTHTPGLPLHIPLAAIPKADIELRPELEIALRYTGINPKDILTLTDLPITSPEDPPLELVLVDHNEPTGPFSLDSPTPPKIIGCIDHHQDENVVPQDANLRIIQKVGSCATLALGELIKGKRHGLLSADAAVDAVLGKLMLAPVLVDTGCLDTESRATYLDDTGVKAAEELIAKGRLEGNDGKLWKDVYSRKMYYEELQMAKGNIRKMSLRNILRKDYKRWREGVGDQALTMGISAVPQGFEQLLERPNEGKDVFMDAVKSWATEQGLDIIAVMTAFQEKDGTFARELLVWAITEGGHSNATLGYFAEHNEKRLGLKQWKGGLLDLPLLNGQEEWRQCWVQEKTDHSRKQVGPWLREAMRGWMEQVSILELWCEQTADGASGGPDNPIIL